MTTLTASTNRNAVAMGARLAMLETPGAGSVTDRRWGGKAYSGGVFAQWWCASCIIDLETLRLPSPGTSIPARLSHDRPKDYADPKASLRAGYADTFRLASDGLSLQGGFIDSQVARTIVKDADQKYPWQLSIIAEGPWSEVVDGQTETVNGIEVGPGTYVMRHGVLRAVDFVELGADATSGAAMLAGNGGGSPPAKLGADGMLTFPGLKGDDPEADWKRSASLRAYWQEQCAARGVPDARSAFLEFARAMQRHGDDYRTVSA